MWCSLFYDIHCNTTLLIKIVNLSGNASSKSIILDIFFLHRNAYTFTYWNSNKNWSLFPFITKKNVNLVGSLVYAVFQYWTNVPLKLTFFMHRSSVSSSQDKRLTKNVVFRPFICIRCRTSFNKLFYDLPLFIMNRFIIFVEKKIICTAENCEYSLFAENKKSSTPLIDKKWWSNQKLHLTVASATALSELCSLGFQLIA